jgi:hypothetical protein
MDLGHGEGDLGSLAVVEHWLGVQYHPGKASEQKGYGSFHVRSCALGRGSERYLRQRLKFVMITDADKTNGIANF